MKNARFTVLLAVLGAALAVPLQAVEYTRIEPERSRITFVYKQMNAPTEGSFKRFTSQLKLDPANPASGSARFDVEVASIDTGSAEGDDEVRGAQWFNAKAHPRAQFVSTTIKSAGPKLFDVTGKLTIKGKTQDVSTRATLREEGQQAVLEGSFVIKRTDFGIGEGVWTDPGTVAHDVQIRFRLLASAGGSVRQ
ncbi:YceI family protein [Uliginosibacterium sp. H1]|uniref:YceI family protein n=1 Tax=Uliginosibacterium sp. H1 TaxID=3114757 RepID=UPI002E16DF2C|nr:YceI family protein [Uliginosibacterium sp. H1]